MGIFDVFFGQRQRLKPGRKPGFKMSEEHKQKISEGMKKAWERRHDAQAFM